MRALKFVSLALVAIVCLSRLAVAAPLTDPSRLALGVGASAEFKAAADAGPESEAAVNLFGSWALTQDFSGAVRGTLGVTDRDTRLSPGVHYRVRVGNESFASALTYDFYGPTNAPRYVNEWVVSILYGRPVGRYLSLAAVESYGLDNHEARTSLQLTAPLWVGKDKP